MKLHLCQTYGHTEVWSRRAECSCHCSGDFWQPEGAMVSQGAVCKPPHLWTLIFQFYHHLFCSSFFSGWFPVSPMGISNPTTNPPSAESEVVVQTPSGWVPGKEQSGQPNPQQSGNTEVQSSILSQEKKKKECIYTCSLRAFPIPLDVFLHRFFCPQKGIPNEKPWLLWYPCCQQLVTVWHHWANI